MPFKVNLCDKFFTLVGRRHSGKSQMVKWLIKKQRHHFKEIFVICPSAFNGDYKGLVPDSNIMTDFKEEWVNSLIQKMAEANKGKNKEFKDFKRVLLILDDVVSSEIKSHHSKSIKILASRGRHLGCSVAVLSQWLTSVSPLQRLNSDYLFIGKTNAKSINILFNEFNLGNMSEPEFRRFVEQNTNDFNFLIINNAASNTTDLTNVYGRLKASLDDEKIKKVEIKI
jgi:hypothetical protein